MVSPRAQNLEQPPGLLGLLSRFVQLRPLMQNHGTELPDLRDDIAGSGYNHPQVDRLWAVVYEEYIIIIGSFKDHSLSTPGWLYHNIIPLGQKSIDLFPRGH